MNPEEYFLHARQAPPGAFLARTWPEDGAGPGSGVEAAARPRLDAGWDAPAAAQGATVAEEEAEGGKPGAGDWRPRTARLQAHVDDSVRRALLGALQLLKEPVRRLLRSGNGCITWAGKPQEQA